jgi:hypothetical protein
MANWDQQEQGGKKTEYLGNHTYTTEAGHVVEFDNTPGDCRIHVYHKSGTFIEIKDDGAMITTTKGGRQDFNDKGRDEVTTGDFNLTVAGAINIYCTGNVIQHVDGNYELNVGGDLKVKVGGNELREVIGDQRTQVNGKTAHRTSKERDEVTGESKTETINRNYFQSVGTDSTLIAGGDYVVLAGDDFQAVATDQIGLGGGGIVAIASADQIQIKSSEGMFLNSAVAVQITSTGSYYPSYIHSNGNTKAGVFSDENDIVLGAGGKVRSATDGGTKLDSAGLIAPTSKIVPGMGLLGP